MTDVTADAPDGSAVAARAGAATFGDVTGEYLALRNAAGLVAPWHDLVWVEGPDTVTFLDGLLSQAIDRLAPGEVASSLLLAPQGKLRAPLIVLAGAEQVGLLTHLGCGAAVVEDLTRFKIRVKATLTADPRPVVDVWGPGSAEVLGEMGLNLPTAGRWERTTFPDTEGPDGPGVVVASTSFPGTGLPRYIVAGLDVGRFGDVVRAGRLAADAVRIEAGAPLMDVDIDGKTIPAEADLVTDAVAFDKGCYLGQELVARIDSRGRVNRHLRGLTITENVLPPIGALVTGHDRDLGRITSVAESLGLRAPVALALLRREAEPGDHVEIAWDGGSTTAVVRQLPMDDFR